MNYLDFVISAQKFGQSRGLTSICSAHPVVLEAAFRDGLARNTPLLIEATCNQVNQFGGYTGLTPADFVGYVAGIADRVGFPRQNLLLGGDHLGPLVWAGEPASVAMDKAKTLVRDYVQAGFSKVHLDCSMACVDDKDFTVELIAERAAQLAQAAESAAHEAPLLNRNLRYVIGSEVPPAGGAKAGETHLTVTDSADAARTIALTRRAFSAVGLDSAWERVIALVVQPGVEFGDESVHEYDRLAAAGLARFIETVPGLVYEAHSTDYQTRAALRALVRDHFGILKVGPGLTFAFREAVFALAEIEESLCKSPSHIRETLEAAMLSNPLHWQKHYSGDAQTQKFARSFSFSDRIRYYWNTPETQHAFEQLMLNLGEKPLPLALLSQYLPKQYQKIRSGELQNQARLLLLGRVMEVLEDYAFASGGNCGDAL
ncbi:MAG: class II D-tagatose-bisphosphate aldolase, non-catalytic subunit [Anaerolineales bacterium]|jgi:D-tagatose-1,6-bisphosphate aldolase subunit GatZ/KbaZ|nr:class II D-tagatose-bisphosphate aldolase, non-catalytic subunit [Anaerolineales bacterium]